MTDDERPLDEARFQGLEEASLDLAVQVGTLVRALQVVAELQKAQQDQSERQAATEAQVTRDQIIALDRYRRVNRVQLMTAIGVAVAVPMVSLLAYWTLTVQVNAQFTETTDDLFATCEKRNYANVSIPQKREQELAEAFKIKDPLVSAIHTRSAADLAASRVDCSRYKKDSK